MPRSSSNVAFLQNRQGLIYFMGDVTSSLIYENVYLLLSTDDLLVFSWVKTNLLFLGCEIYVTSVTRSWNTEPITHYNLSPHLVKQQKI
ncbi:hypothetical protein AB205_0015330 [Aquarana catesbeiana]|uniref:Uncharacterized protein n=1 Tax=Aquarana catesbeiana TaxID=8400 RepID=A0A2G9P8H9_AQUCT|nr:hypothetical protein AB205_0015330 [Aquarana catesbeiana]